MAEKKPELCHDKQQIPTLERGGGGVQRSKERNGQETFSSTPRFETGVIIVNTRGIFVSSDEVLVHGNDVAGIYWLIVQKIMSPCLDIGR